MGNKKLTLKERQKEMEELNKKTRQIVLLTIAAVMGLVLVVSALKQSNIKKKTEDGPDMINGYQLGELDIKSEEEFEEKVKNSEGLVFVDFYADWCPPCVTMEPVIKELAQEEGFEVYKLHVDKFTDISSQEGARYLPTFTLYEDGVKQKDTIGVQTKEELIAFINGEVAENIDENENVDAVSIENEI